MSAPLSLDLVVSSRDITEPRPSPDGRWIGFIRRWRGRSELLVVPVGGGAATPLAFGAEPSPGRGLGGGGFAWLPDSDGVVFVGVDGEVWLTRGAESRPVTRFERSCRAPSVGVVDGRLAVVVAVDEAEVWLVAIDEESAGGRDGEARRIDDGRHEFCFDPVVSVSGQMASWVGWSPPWMAWDAAERVDVVFGGAPDGHTDRYRDRTPDRNSVVSAWKPDDGAVSEPRFAPDGMPTHVHDGSGWRNVYVGGRPVLPESLEQAGATWGMGNRSYDVGADGRAVVTRNVRGGGQLVAVQPGGDTAVLDDSHVWGQVSIVGERIVALRSAPGRPGEIVVIDPRAHGPSARPARVIVGSGVAAWRTVEPPRIETLDTTIPARRVVAGGREREQRADPVRDTAPDPASGFDSNSGRRRGPATLCWIHGGPTDQWRNDFRPRLDYWTSRGYQIVIPDHRGSTGYGRAFQQALHGGWGRTDVDDIAAVLAELHMSGVTDSASTVIVGGSSGGGAVLGILADHPQLVAGGIASYPVSDLADLAARSHRLEAHYTDTLVGPRDDAAAFARLSVIHRAAQITKPLLVFHGSDDPVVPAEQTEQLVATITAHAGAAARVEHVVYDGEGHGFRDPDNVADEYARMQAFLDALFTH
ncbi:MAG: prolyl oligopeptidase family serine peptidase [Actinomycetota bacterium]